MLAQEVSDHGTLVINILQFARKMLLDSMNGNGDIRYLLDLISISLDFFKCKKLKEKT